MKIKIVIEDKKKGKVVLPITINEIRDVYDAMYIVTDPETVKDLKLNKVDKSFFNFHRKMEHIVHDIIYDGKVGQIKEIKKGKKKSFRFIPEKKRHYLVKKPKWLKRK